MNSKKMYVKKQKEDDSFMDLNSFQSTKNMEEIELIDNTLVDLQENIYQYINDSQKIWDEQIKTFLRTDDCNTLQYLSVNDDDKFVEFMLTQKTFKIMMIAKARLNRRRDYLMYQN